MKRLLALLALCLFFTKNSSAAVCVGKNCELIDHVARNSGISLNQILSEIDSNIVNPVVDSQRCIASWEGGMLQFTPRGSENTVKVTLWGGGAWRYVDINSNVFGSTVNFGYYTGNFSVSLGVELPFDKKTDLILNGSFWTGQSDYGIGLTKNETRETSGRLGVGIRKKFNIIDVTDFFIAGGLITGRKSSDMTLTGTEVSIRYLNEQLSWSGDEKYYEKLTYISIPILFGKSFYTPWVTLSIAGGGSTIFQFGRIDLSKWGPIGPYGGFYNVGVSSSSDTTGFLLAPMMVLGAESNLESVPNFTMNFRPGFINFPMGGSVGVGWKFLVVR